MKLLKLGMGVLTACWCGWGLAEAPAPALVRHAAAPPVIDGVLDDAAWAEAQAYPMLDIKAGGILAEDTEFKLVCDNAWLYIAVDCRNPDLAKIREALGPKVTGHDQGASQDDSVEVFLDPGTGGKVYFHYMLSWAGAKDERRITGGSRETGWDFPWRSATAVNPEGWAGELALPLYVFTAFNTPDQFRFNLTRNKRIPDIDGSGVIVAERKEWRSFAPIVRSFHEPDRFAPLAGIPDAGLEIPFLVELKKAEVLPYGVVDGGNYYEVAVELEGKNHRAGRVKISVQDQPAVGPGHDVAEDVEVAGEAIIRKIIRVPVANLAERDVTVSVQTIESGETLNWAQMARPAALKVMRVYADRNYYTAEDTALIVCELGLPAEALAEFRLCAVAAGVEIGRMDEVGPETRLPVKLAELGQGHNAVTVELRRKAGNERYFTCELPIIKREPKPGCEWKIDHINRVVLNNGKPFFPIGLVMARITYADEKDFKRVAEAGFNTYFQWAHLENTADIFKYLDLLKQLNMYYVESPDFHMQHVRLDGIDRYFDEATAAELHKISFQSYFVARKALMGLGGVSNKHFQKLTPAQQDELYIEYYAKNMPRILDVIGRVRDNPLLTSYFIMDEDGDRNSRSVGRNLYRQIHAADGYHPIIRNFSSYIGEITDCFDIIMTDPYWTPGRAAMGARATPDFVAKITWMTYHRGEQYRQACWQTLVGNLWSGFRKRPLTFAEQLNQCHLAVIYGASGLSFFCYPFHYQEGWDAMQEVCRRFRVIGPLANGGRIDQTATYESAVLEAPDAAPAFQPVVFDYWKDTYPEVHARVFRMPDGEYLLLAANARYYPVTATFAIDGMAGAVEPLFGGNQQAAVDHKFTEKIEPLGVRAYRLRGVTESVNMRVSMTHLQSEAPPPEEAWPNDYRPDRKNELLNPGFEAATVKGWPDYWFPSFSHDMDNMAGSADPSWGQVTNQPYQGEYCLIMRHPVYSTQIHCNPQNDKAVPYTISFWARANRPGLKIWLYPRQMERLDGVEYDAYKASRTFDLSVEWRRYEHTALLPARIGGSSSWNSNILDFRVKDMTEGGTVWLDAIQFEQGMQATEFEE